MNLSRTVRRWLLVQAVFYVLAAAMIAAPLAQETGERQPVVVSPVQELAWGEQRLASFLENRQRTLDSQLQFRVSRIGQQVARVSDRPNFLYRFLVLQGDDLQAFAFPGGTVCLTEALVALYASDDELAFALGHELAHIVLRHHVFRLRMDESLRVTTPGSDLSINMKSFFDKDTEMEADRFGALYAVRAGYRYTGTVTALERLAKNARTRQDAAHPEYQRRVAALGAFRVELERTLKAFDRGVAALKAGEPEKAVSRLTLFVGEFPNSVAGRINLGAAYLARVRFSAGTPEGLSEVLTILPDPGIMVRGMYDASDLQHAGQNFREALVLQPQESLAAARLALVQMRMGELDGARLSLGQALSSDPDGSEILLCLGNIEYLAKNYPSALFFYDQALATRPGWARAEKNRALTFEKLGDTGQALDLWSVVAEEADLRQEAKLNMARLQKQAK